MKIGTISAALLMLASIFAGVFVIAEGTNGGSPMAPVIRYVDGDGDSTYTTIQDALDDANDGDTVIIADGSYAESGLDITKSNLVIQGNTTGTGVMVTSSVLSPCALIDSVTNVTVNNINFTHDSAQGMRIYNSDNITLNACIFWSQGGNNGALDVDNSENITVAGDLFGGTFTRIHSEGDDNPSLRIESSEYVVAMLAQLESDGVKSHTMACIGNCPYVGAAFSLFNASGSTSSALFSDDHIYGMFMGNGGTYTDKIIRMRDGLVESYDTEVPDTDVEVGATGKVLVYFERTIVVKDENDHPVENVDIELSNEVEGVIYQTAKFGGLDPTTDEDGEIRSNDLLTKVFPGSSTPNYGENRVRYFYGHGDVPVSGNIAHIDANTTDDYELVLPDFDAPEDPLNVHAETISHERIDLSFDASPSTDMDHYEIWIDSGDGYVWDINTTDAGLFPYLALEPDTEYHFMVMAIDDDGLNSTGAEVMNTTEPPVNGSIRGMVGYSGGDMDGMPADGATVKVLNSTMAVLAQTTVNETGYYIMEEIAFGDGYHLIVTPVEAVEDMGTESGYIEWSWEFDHTSDMSKNISLEYYEYDSDSIQGKVIYSGGPMDGMNATDASVMLYNETMVEIANTTTNETTGMYMFEDIQFGVNYTLKVVPADAVEMNGTETGYLCQKDLFDHDGALTMNFTLPYYEYDSDSIHGQVTYSGGPMDGMNATNATVILYNETMVEIANTTTNETTGMYMFEDIQFGVNYTLKVIPLDAVEDGGDQSGYITVMADPFNHTGELAMDMMADHYTYTPPAPTTGPISGTISYDGGPKDGEAASGVLVSMMDEDGMYHNTTTNGTGVYLFEGMEFGNYSIEVIPMDSDMGETGVRSGYMKLEIEEFTLDSADGVQKDGSLPYYTYEEPQPEHPTITILDENGDPVEGVTVTVTIDGTEYEAETDENGDATFTDLEGESFPDDAEFKAEKDGYDTMEWKEGESVPEMKEEEAEDDNLLMMILIAAILLIVIIIIFLMLRKKGDEAEFEE